MSDTWGCNSTAAQEWCEVRDPVTGRLLFKYEAETRIIEVKMPKGKGNRRIRVDLTRLEK